MTAECTTFVPFASWRRRDVHNVKRDFNIGCVRRHEDDHTSVDVWVQELTEMKEANPILLYKRQGVEAQSTVSTLAACYFILCVQTVTQRNFLHGINQYGINLVTLIVVDDFREANPVAFTICTIEDENALCSLFLAIKVRLPDGTVLTASHVTTDDAPQDCKRSRNERKAGKIENIGRS